MATCKVGGWLGRERVRPMPALNSTCKPSHCAIQVGVEAVVGSEEVQVVVELGAGEGEWRGCMAGSIAEIRVCSSRAVRVRRWAQRRVGVGGRCQWAWLAVRWGQSRSRWERLAGAALQQRQVSEPLL